MFVVCLISAVAVHRILFYPFTFFSFASTFLIVSYVNEWVGWYLVSKRWYDVCIVFLYPFFSFLAYWWFLSIFRSALLNYDFSSKFNLLFLGSLCLHCLYYVLFFPFFYYISWYFEICFLVDYRVSKFNRSITMITFKKKKERKREERPCLHRIVEFLKRHNMEKRWTKTKLLPIHICTYIGR